MSLNTRKWEKIIWSAYTLYLPGVPTPTLPYQGKGKLKLECALNELQIPIITPPDERTRPLARSLCGYAPKYKLLTSVDHRAN